ncbi:MAG: orotidine 5'-phosphate decarboxylase [archaeon GB-1867-005]|nr:orotidine 5'-phosphate decarboxylase [Candidatus Culexmicrobium cathedralense]
MAFRYLIEKASEERKSRIVLALDLSALPKDLGREALKKRALKVLREVNQYICAVKINMQLLLPLGLYFGVKEVVDEAHSLGLPVIIDCKLSDVGHTNAWATRHYFEAGFDAIIINPIIGWEQGAQPVFEVAKEYGGRGVILLVYTSHKAAPESYELLVRDPESGLDKPLYVIFAERAVRWGADGAVVGATYPEKVKAVAEVLRNKVPIFSPGVGVQGGRIEPCLKAGSKYFIIGRSIFNAEKPAEAAKFFRDLAWLEG